LQLEEAYSVTGDFFELTKATKSRYPFRYDDNHGWVALEEER